MEVLVLVLVYVVFFYLLATDIWVVKTTQVPPLRAHYPVESCYCETQLISSGKYLRTEDFSGEKSCMCPALYSYLILSLYWTT
jgi:hypothetical protein